MSDDPRSLESMLVRQYERCVQQIADELRSMADKVERAKTPLHPLIGPNKGRTYYVGGAYDVIRVATTMPHELARLVQAAHEAQNAYDAANGFPKERE